MKRFKEYMVNDLPLKIGVVGYSGQKFNEQRANVLIRNGLEKANQLYHFNHRTSELVSGLTNLGIPALAYKISKEFAMKTVGIACSQAKNYECYPVDKEIIVGDEWGDESETFLDYIDVLIRVGGGKQTIKETEEAKKRSIPVFEYDLEAL